MSWETHCAKSAFVHYTADWDRLNAQLYQNHPFFDSRFVVALLEHFADGKELLCLYRSDGVVCGALIVKDKGLGRWVSFRPSQTQATAILVDDAGRLASLFGALPGYAWSLELNAIDPRYAPDFLALPLPQVAQAHAYTVGICSGLDFKDYWTHRPTNLKANLRRYVNRAEKASAQPRLASLTDPHEMSVGVARFGALETSGWKGAAGTAVSIDNLQGKFYASLLARFAQAQQATIHELYIGEQLAASRLVIGNAHMLVILKTAYDESLARFAPGRILLHRVIEHQLSLHPEQTIEFYTNATHDQNEWGTFGCTIQNMQIFRNDASAAAFSMLKALRRRVKGAAGRRPVRENDLLTPTVKVFSALEGKRALNCDVGEFFHSDDLETSLDWFELLQRTVFPKDSGVRYYCAGENGRVATILPIRLTTQGRIKTVESLGNYYTSLYVPLQSATSDPLHFGHLLAAATREHGGAHVMRFAPMAAGSTAYRELENGLRAIGWLPFRFFCFGNWFLKVDGDWEHYLKSRSGNLRSAIKRRSKNFAASGGSLEIATGGEALEHAIDAYTEVYSASWKKPEPYPAFTPALIHLLAGNGMLRLGIARLNGKPIAAQLWMVGGKRAQIYKVAYHEHFSAYSPGTVLTSHLMQHVIEKDHVSEVDFLIGDDKYKRIWMSDRRERWGIIAYNPRTFLGCALLGKEISGRMVKALREKAGTRLVKSRRFYASQTACLKRIMEKYQRHQADAHATAMNWKVLPIARFGDHAEQWDTLVRSMPGTPFLESIFVQPCIDVFARGVELLCLLHINGHLRAAAIMQPGPRKGVWQTFQPSQLPLGAWISDGSVDVTAACDALIGRLPGIALSVGASQLDSRLATRREDSARVRHQDYIQTAWVDVEGHFEDYWDARGKNLRQNTRKQRNKLQSDGITVRMECLTEPHEVGQAIDDYGRLESAGWKAADGTAIRPDNAQGRFYREMLEGFFHLGRGRIYQLRFDDKVVAMDLCIADRHALVVLKTAYDESCKSISPSTLLRHDQFEQLFAERTFARIEFYGKVMEWHTRWTSQSRPLFHATVYRWAWLKRLHAFVSGTAPSEQAALPSPLDAPPDAGHAEAAP